MAKSAAEIVDSRGGPSEVARRIDVDPTVVRMWKHRNIIPRSAWPELQLAYPDITLAELMATERARVLELARAS